jgi:hypothetical protein
VYVLFYNNRTNLDVYFITVFKIVLTKLLNMPTSYSHAAIEVSGFSFHLFDGKKNWVGNDTATRWVGAPSRVLEVGETYYPLDYIIGYTQNFPCNQLALRNWAWLFGLLFCYIISFGFIKKSLISKTDCGTVVSRVCEDMVDGMPYVDGDTPNTLYKELLRHGARDVTEERKL